MSTWLSWCYIRLWFCVRFAVSELLSGSCNMLLLLFSSGASVTKINTIFIAIINVTHRLFFRMTTSFHHMSGAYLQILIGIED